MCDSGGLWLAWLEPVRADQADFYHQGWRGRVRSSKRAVNFDLYNYMIPIFELPAGVFFFSGYYCLVSPLGEFTFKFRLYLTNKQTNETTTLNLRHTITRINILSSAIGQRLHFECSRLILDCKEFQLNVPFLA